MAADNVIKTQFDKGTITFIDGAGTEKAVRFDNANFSYGELKDEFSVPKIYQSRRVMHSFRKGELEPPQISFDCMVAEITETSAGTLFEFIHGVGVYSGRTSTTAAKGDLQTFDIRLDIEGSDYGRDDGDETFTMEDVFVSWNFSLADPNTAAFTGLQLGALSGDLAIAMGRTT